MKFLKGLALSLLGFLLFLSLSIFGMAFTVNSTALNPKFITSELNKLDMSSLAKSFIDEQVRMGGLPQELGTSLADTITEFEPLVKEKIGDATYSIYDYLLGRRQSPDLALTFRNSFLGTDFIVSIVDKLDLAPLAKEFLTNQLAKDIPAEYKKYLNDSLDGIVLELKPWITEQVKIATDPVLDYLLGKSQTLNIVISLEPAKEIVKNNIKEAFLKSPPPEFAAVPPAELAQYFDQFYQGFSSQIPSSFDINESLIGTDVPVEIAQGLSQAEGQLEQARHYIGLFRVAYIALIAFMLLIVAGIILINRQVKAATRGLGTTFLTYGAFEYAGILIARYFETKYSRIWLPAPEVPPALATWIQQLMNDLIAPLAWLSLGFIIVGIALIVVSFVYKPRQSNGEN